MNRTFLLAACTLLISCKQAPPVATIDPALARCIPPGTAILAGVDLDSLRASPLYARLPAAMQELAKQFPGAHSLLAASRGNDMLLISGPGPALSGTPELIAAAEAQRKTGKSGAPDLLARGEAAAGGSQIWIVARGDVTLPLTGNGANLNHLLRNMEYAALTVRSGSTAEIDLTARGRSPDAARHFEETLRAAITMAAAGEGKHSDVAGMLRSIQVRREDRMVRAGFKADADAMGRLIGMLTE